jgi:hypothetical protein
MVNNMVIKFRSANVGGVSKIFQQTHQCFNILGLSDKIKHIVIDICNFKDINKVILDEKPDFVFIWQLKQLYQFHIQIL